jgi:hypothetical protein
MLVSFFRGATKRRHEWHSICGKQLTSSAAAVIAMFLAQHYLADSTTTSTTDVMMKEQNGESRTSKKQDACKKTRSGTEIWWALWLAIYWEILGSQTLDRKLTLSYSWSPPDSQRATFWWKFTHHDGSQRISSHLCCSTSKKQAKLLASHI